MHYPGMQHSRKFDVAYPFCLARNLGVENRIFYWLADYRIVTRWLERRIAGDLQAEEACEVSFDGDRKVNNLARHELAVSLRFAATRHNAIGYVHGATRNAKLLCAQFQHCFSDIGSRLA